MAHCCKGYCYEVSTFKDHYEYNSWICAAVCFPQAHRCKRNIVNQSHPVWVGRLIGCGRPYPICITPKVRHSYPAAFYGSFVIAVIVPASPRAPLGPDLLQSTLFRLQSMRTVITLKTNFSARRPSPEHLSTTIGSQWLNCTTVALWIQPSLMVLPIPGTRGRSLSATRASSRRTECLPPRLNQPQHLQLTMPLMAFPVSYSVQRCVVINFVLV